MDTKKIILRGNSTTLSADTTFVDANGVAQVVDLTTATSVQCRLLRGLMMHPISVAHTVTDADTLTVELPETLEASNYALEVIAKVDTNTYRCLINVFVTITEEPVEATEVVTYTITVEVADGQGDYGSVSGGGTLQEGKTCTIKATANDGYEFVSWNDGYTGASRIVKATEDKTYTASFAVKAEEVLWYIGQTTLKASAFADLTTSELVANSQSFPTSQRTANVGLDNSIWFIMLPDGYDVADCQYIADGITSSFANADVHDTSIFGATHDDVVINNKTYHIYGNRNTALVDSGDKATVNIKNS